MYFSYIFYFEILIGILTAIKAKQKNRNIFFWWVLGTGFSLIAYSVVLAIPPKIVEET